MAAQNTVRRSDSRWYHFGKSFRATLLLLFAVDILILGLVLVGLVLTRISNSQLSTQNFGIELDPIKATLSTIFDDTRREILLAEQSVILVHNNPSMFVKGTLCKVSACPAVSGEDEEFMMYSSGRTGIATQSSTSTIFASLSHLYLFNTQGIVDEMQIHINTSDEVRSLYMPVRNQVMSYACNWTTNSPWSVSYSEQAVIICKRYSSQTINMTIMVRLLATQLSSAIIFDRSNEALTVRAVVNNVNIVYFKSRANSSDSGVSSEDWQFALDDTTKVSLVFDYQEQETIVSTNETMASTLALLFLLAIFIAKQRIDQWCRHCFGIVNNICNVLITSLDDTFLGKPLNGDRIILTESIELQKLANRLLGLSTNLTNLKKNHKSKELLEPFRLEGRLKILVDNLRAHLAPTVITSVETIFNNREILRCVRMHCEEQEKMYKELLAEAYRLGNLTTFYTYAYNSIIMADTERFKEFALEKGSEQNSEMVNFFYYANHMIRTKSPAKFIEMGVGGLSDIVDNAPNMLRTVALFRIQGLLLSKLFIVIKESDTNRQHIRQLNICSQVEDLEQEIENCRHELSERSKLYMRLTNEPGS